MGWEEWLDPKDTEKRVNEMIAASDQDDTSPVEKLIGYSRAAAQMLAFMKTVEFCVKKFADDKLGAVPLGMMHALVLEGKTQAYVLRKLSDAQLSLIESGDFPIKKHRAVSLSEDVDEAAAAIVERFGSSFAARLAKALKKKPSA